MESETKFLDKENMNIHDSFITFIKEQGINDLIAFDNKIFGG